MPWRRKWQPAPVYSYWRIPWTEEAGGLQSTGSQRVGSGQLTNKCLCSADSGMDLISLSHATGGGRGEVDAQLFSCLQTPEASQSGQKKHLQLQDELLVHNTPFGKDRI